jgi:hypothetical protein
MGLANALRVESHCVDGTGIVREHRKGNARRWKPIPESWGRATDQEGSMCVCSKLSSVINRAGL